MFKTVLLCDTNDFTSALNKFILENKLQFKMCQSKAECNLVMSGGTTNLVHLCHEEVDGEYGAETRGLGEGFTSCKLHAGVTGKQNEAFIMH